MIIHGDALEELRKLEDNSVDAIVCDPPAGVAFMGAKWDDPNYFPLRDRTGSRKTGDGKPTNASGFGSSMAELKRDKQAREAFVSFLTDVMAEARRVLKPGGSCLVWSLPRTSHWTALALEDAGFEIRDCVYHLYGVDAKVSAFYSTLSDEQRNLFTQILDSQDAPSALLHIFGSGFPKSLNLGDGRGTALKPSVETWWLCRKPLAERSVAANVLTYGTGALNIDASRVGTSGESRQAHYMTGKGVAMVGNVEENWSNPYPKGNAGKYTTTLGRFPSHLLLSHTLLCTEEQCAEGGTKIVPAYVHGRDVVTPLTSIERVLDLLPNVLQNLREHSKNGNNPVNNEDVRGYIERMLSGYSLEDLLDPDVVKNPVRECARVLGWSQFASSLSGCPSCLRLCGEYVHLLLKAFQDGAPSLIDALSLVCLFLEKHEHSPRYPENDLSNLDDLRQINLEPGIQQSNTCACQHSFDTSGKISHKQHTLFEVERRASPHDSSDENNMCESCKHEKFDHSKHILDLSYLLSFLSFDLACQYLPALIIHQSHDVINSPICPVAALDEQSGIRKSGGRKPSGRIATTTPARLFNSNQITGYMEPSEGGASRYFQTFRPEVPFIYAAKASRKDRNSNGAVNNTHPTTKNTTLMRYLVRMITPPGGIVLDCFGGSGSTALACIAEGMDYILIEQDASYIEIAKARVAHAEGIHKAIWEELA
jgi:DNA modification methylase